MGNEQRRHVRRSLVAQVRAKDTDGVGTLLFETADFSPGGTFLRSDLLLEEGEPLILEFEIPGTSRALSAQARVVWVRRFPKAGEEAGMGVEFLSMSEGDRAALTRYLDGGGLS